MTSKNDFHSLGRRQLMQVAAGNITLTVGANNIIDTTTAKTTSRGDLEWSFQTGNSIWESSPTVVDDTVYIASSGVYALDAGTGNQKWCFKDEPINGSPVVESGTVYIENYALDAENGDKQWNAEDIREDVFSSPTVFNNIIYVGTDSDNLYALEAESGDIIWQFETGGAVKTAPTVVAGTVFFGSHDRNIYAVDAETGDQQWSFYTGQIVDSSPTVVDSVVYIASGTGDLYAIDAESGNKQWQSDVGISITSSPTVIDGTIFVGDGGMYAVDVEDGEQQWNNRIGVRGVTTSSPTVANDVVFVGTDDGVYALNTATGTQQWHFETEGWVRSSPTVVDGIVYIGSSDGNLYALDAGVSGSSEGSRVRLRTLGHHDQLTLPSNDSSDGEGSIEGDEIDRYSTSFETDAGTLSPKGKLTGTVLVEKIGEIVHTFSSTTA